jgi:hypothetical protein
MTKAVDVTQGSKTNKTHKNTHTYTHALTHLHTHTLSLNPNTACTLPTTNTEHMRKALMFGVTFDVLDESA